MESSTGPPSGPRQGHQENVNGSFLPLQSPSNDFAQDSLPSTFSGSRHHSNPVQSNSFLTGPTSPTPEYRTQFPSANQLTSLNSSFDAYGPFHFQNSMTTPPLESMPGTSTSAPASSSNQPSMSAIDIGPGSGWSSRNPPPPGFVATYGASADPIGNFSMAYSQSQEPPLDARKRVYHESFLPKEGKNTVHRSSSADLLRPSSRKLANRNAPLTGLDEETDASQAKTGTHRSEDDEPSTEPLTSVFPASASGLPSSVAYGGDKDAAARKQNSACDACRNRKVRCHRAPGEEKCSHCRAKGIECTTIYVQLATTGAKRPSKRLRMDVGEGTIGEGTRDVGEESTNVVKYILLRDSDYANHVFGLSYPEMARRRPPTTAAESRLANATARHEFVSSLLETYFSTVHIRYPILDPQEFSQRFHHHSTETGGPPSDVLIAVLLAWGAKFSTHPIILADRREAANEELSPTQVQKRTAANERADGKKRNGEASVNTNNRNKGIGRSRIAEDLIVKAQEVLDRNKAHRIATMDNTKAALIIQALFWQQASETECDDATVPAELRSRKRRGVYICNGVWVNSALQHMFEMKVHLQETVVRISDENQRNQIAMSWWLACMMDAHMSAFYRKKPVLSKDDYTTQPPLPLSVTSNDGPQQGPQPMAPDQGFRIWINSALDQVEMMRAVYPTLWTPLAKRQGISARKLERLVSMAYRWRSTHLPNVGAPDPDWPSHWKFADAVTACSSDINYQIIWVLIWQAVDEFGIAELKVNDLSSFASVSLQHGESIGIPTTVAEMELEQSKIGGLRKSIYDEALKASLRCADLSGMLCDFDYLQHEAGIMKFSLCEVGYCLTQFKRPEVYKIIDGLRQYGQAFEECYHQANELERLSASYISADNLSTLSSSQYAMGTEQDALLRQHGTNVPQVFNTPNSLSWTPSDGRRTLNPQMGPMSEGFGLMESVDSAANRNNLPSSAFEYYHGMRNSHASSLHHYPANMAQFSSGNFSSVGEVPYQHGHLYRGHGLSTNPSQGSTTF